MRKVWILTIAGLLIPIAAGVAPALLTTMPCMSTPPKGPDVAYGIGDVVTHGTCVEHSWFNGNESYAFLAAPEQTQELIFLFSASRLRDHKLRIRKMTEPPTELRPDRVLFNVVLHKSVGLTYAVYGKDREPQPIEPTLSLYVDPEQDGSWLEEIEWPDNLIIENETDVGPLVGSATRPVRQYWYAEITDEGTEAPHSPEYGRLKIHMTLWEKDNPWGFPLGHVRHDGLCRIAISEQEIADLETGRTWITMTVGNHLTEVKPTDRRVSIEQFTPDRTEIDIPIRPPLVQY